MLFWWATMLDVVPDNADPRAAIELRSLAPAAELVPCIERSLVRTGIVATRPVDGGTQIDVLAKAADVSAPRDAVGFSIRITEAGTQRVIRATFQPPVTAAIAQRRMGQAARKCFREEWRTHEWERH